MLWLAMAEQPSDPFVFLLNFGTLGVVFVLLLTGFLHTKPSVDRLLKELADKDDVIQLLMTTAQQHTIPALATTARVMEAVPSTEAQVINELQALRNRLEQHLTSGGGT